MRALAGLLKGWTESGTRPRFIVVTGISTGALIAPFLFLGSEYDDELEALYTGTKTSDLVKRRRLIAGLTSDALADTQPLRDLLKEHVDAAMIDAIAEEHLQGRRLLIGTTNIDAKRGVIWDISYIATKGTAESRQLIRDIMLASASIPGMFPPVRIQVEADGEEYDELHVDGGVSRQVFLHAVPLNIQELARDMGLDNPRNLYVIRNAMLTPQWTAVKPKLLPVLGASISTLIRTQGMGDLYRLYLGTLRDGTGFKLASVPPDLELTANEDFDPAYMKALFELAYSLARNGYDWQTSPPGIALSTNLPAAASGN
ncbi:MAG: patatin-like phospholipase family protein [Gammaproteobacteria bacterium]|nr:patatin-like phospholipase family protein [Gammaproteobacteria bacterium]NND36914.1 patatin [Gammaproteobacteria bacterium]